MGVTIALPTGRSMEKQTLELFEQANITIGRSNPRSIIGSVSGLLSLNKVIFCRPAEIPRLVSQGICSIGITGKDLLLQSGQTEDVTILDADLSYGRKSSNGARCVMFARADDEVNCVADLNKISGRVEIATEYPEDTEKLLNTLGVEQASFSCQTWSGSSEVAVVTGLCRFGVALVETGSTLAINNLKIIDDSTLFLSKPVVIANQKHIETQLEVSELLQPLCRTLEGAMQSRQSIMVVMNVPKETVGSLCPLLPARQSPTIQPLVDSRFVSLSTVVSTTEVNNVIAAAMKYGAKDFVKMKPIAVI